jgi:hypothetical protein
MKGLSLHFDYSCLSFSSSHTKSPFFSLGAFRLPHSIGQYGTYVDKNNAASPTSILDPESIASAYERFCVKDDSASSTTRRSSRHLAVASTTSSSSRNNGRLSPSTSSSSTCYQSSSTRAPMMAPSASPSPSTTPTTTATITSRHAAADVDTTSLVAPSRGSSSPAHDAPMPPS